MADNKKNAGWRRPVKEENVQIGERCRKAREAAGYTQEKLAETIGRGAAVCIGYGTREMRDVAFHFQEPLLCPVRISRLPAVRVDRRRLFAAFH